MTWMSLKCIRQCERSQTPKVTNGDFVYIKLQKVQTNLGRRSVFAQRQEGGEGQEDVITKGHMETLEAIFGGVMDMDVRSLS